ncbi:MAG: patatin-like phospholipase family protein [Bacteroidia bacterium]|nr:patatin-like phospholipase family protein [Bacteroidia bacterium]
MKRFLIFIGVLACLTGGTIGLYYLLRQTPEPEETMDHSEGTAIVITGAAARIPQEAALLEQLYVTGELKEVAFISGVSSGALNAVMLNAILDGKYSWKRYRNMLFSMNNQSVFISTDKPLPVNTEPLRRLLTTVLHDTLGYFKLKDLPFPTSLSTVSLNIKSWADKTFRLCNLKINTESDPELDLVEVLMASTAFPFAFPPVRISKNSTLPSGRFIDGGTTADYIPYRAVLEFEKFSRHNISRMIIVSRKLDTEEGLRKELLNMGINRLDLVDKLGIALEDLAQRAFFRGLESLMKEAPVLSERTLIYLPAIPGEYPLFDFSNLKNQYLASREWARTHKPIVLATFLKDGISVYE